MVVADLCLNRNGVFAEEASEEIGDVNDMVDHGSTAGEAGIDKPSKRTGSLIRGANAEHRADFLIGQLAHKMGEVW